MRALNVTSIHYAISTVTDIDGIDSDSVNSDNDCDDNSDIMLNEAHDITNTS